jgi:DNA-binding transcriptional ArsR family regulator
MTGNRPSRVVSDIGTLKALASPIRWQILGYLGEHEEATATDLARALGESTGTTSYHLRLLARHGLVAEAASADKRERPWRKVPQDLRFPPIAEDTPAAERDARMAVHRLRLAEDLAHLTALADRDKPEEVAWSRISRSSIRVSQPQLEQFGTEFRALVARHADLAAQAPPGEPTELVQLRLYAFPASDS